MEIIANLLCGVHNLFQLLIQRNLKATKDSHYYFLRNIDRLSISKALQAYMLLIPKHNALLNHLFVGICIEF